VLIFPWFEVWILCEKVNMFRGTLSFASLVVAHAQCPDCAFDLTALEEFSVDFNDVAVSQNGPNSMATAPMSDGLPEEHGTIAVHARNLQLKLDSHVSFPTPFARGNLQLSGMTIHEELHINGATGQASFHLESPIVNVCFQLDHLPPVAHMMQPQIEQNLQQAEQIAPMIFQQNGRMITVDGDNLQCLQDPHRIFASCFSTDSHPKLLAIHMPEQLRREAQSAVNDLRPSPPPAVPDNIAMQFTNYANSVGDQFSVRACEIDSQSATQNLLAASPETQEFIASRIRQHQTRLQALIEPKNLNMRFNFIPLAMADLMVPPTPSCANEELVQIRHNKMSTLQVVAFSVCSFVVGISATFVAFRSKRVTTADDYHQVAA